MDHITVKNLIELLSKCNPDAIVCRLVEGENAMYSSIETVCPQKNVEFIDCYGDEATGDIVSIF